ncbi:SDR family oxidoreductase [Rhizobium sp. B230/85]|uniref:SDR family oxidoreductase n=1 Tax=Rhizobium sp. B230/85 TaxID=2819994 RepID=UPI001C5BEB64|nr:SDR family oxidoreductase [Rhizobium sp. B230/85]QXZ98618.1 SDR family oxidoreductase [Rhizobium sp. B230/85]
MNDIPVRMRQTRMPTQQMESHTGLLCQAVTTSADVGDPQQVGLAVDRSIPEGIRLAGLVLNAGHGRWQSLSQLGHEEWVNTLEGNLTGAFVTIKALLPLFDFPRFPIVMGILSDSVLSAFPDRAAYASAKSGLEMLLSTFRREYRTRGARVCQVYPSRVDTYFSGGHQAARPGTRPNGLSATQIAEAAKWVFEAPDMVEIRALYLSSIKATFGLDEECFTDGH